MIEQLMCIGGLGGWVVVQDCEVVEEVPPVWGNLCALEKLFLKMLVFEEDIGGIW